MTKGKNLRICEYFTEIILFLLVFFIQYFFLLIIFHFRPQNTTKDRIFEKMKRSICSAICSGGAYDQFTLLFSNVVVVVVGNLRLLIYSGYVPNYRLLKKF